MNIQKLFSVISPNLPGKIYHNILLLPPYWLVDYQANIGHQVTLKITQDQTGFNDSWPINRVSRLIEDIQCAKPIWNPRAIYDRFEFVFDAERLYDHSPMAGSPLTLLWRLPEYYITEVESLRKKYSVK